MTSTRTAHPGFQHSAVLHSGDAEYTALIVPFLCEGLEQDETVAVATGAGRADLLRRALGDDAARVTFLDAAEWFVRPGRTIGGWARLLRAGRGAARVINELPFPDGPGASWVRYDAALNAALAGFGVRVLCPYRRGWEETARRCHPQVHDEGRTTSAGYREPADLLAELPEPPYPAPGDPVLSAPIDGDVLGLRTLVRGRAAGWLPADRLETLALAVSELATNAIRYGGPHRTLSLWLTPEAVVGEVTDDGPDAPPVLAGYLPPAPATEGGLGLWLLAQVCDALAISARPTRVRFGVLRSDQQLV